MNDQQRVFCTGNVYGASAGMGIGKCLFWVYGILWCSDENITYNNYLLVRLTIELTIALSDVTMDLPVR